jgi:phage baseplate assembly protein W
MNISKYTVSLSGATLVDINPQFTRDNLPDRIPDNLAVTNSLVHNLLKCTPGERARIFEPSYGSMWLHFIHEPIADITAKKMEIYMIQALAKWIPQITLDRQNTYISVAPDLPGYYVSIQFSSPYSVGTSLVSFNLSV